MLNSLLRALEKELFQVQDKQLFEHSKRKYLPWKGDRTWQSKKTGVVLEKANEHFSLAYNHGILYWISET